MCRCVCTTHRVNSRFIIGSVQLFRCLQLWLREVTQRATELCPRWGGVTRGRATRPMVQRAASEAPSASVGQHQQNYHIGTLNDNNNENSSSFDSSNHIISSSSTTQIANQPPNQHSQYNNRRESRLGLGIGYTAYQSGYNKLFTQVYQDLSTLDVYRLESV